MRSTSFFARCLRSTELATTRGGVTLGAERKASSSCGIEGEPIGSPLFLSRICLWLETKSFREGVTLEVYLLAIDRTGEACLAFHLNEERTSRGIGAEEALFAGAGLRLDLARDVDHELHRILSDAGVHGDRTRLWRCGGSIPIHPIRVGQLEGPRSVLVEQCEEHGLVRELLRRARKAAVEDADMVGQVHHAPVPHRVPEMTPVVVVIAHAVEVDGLAADAHVTGHVPAHHRDHVAERLLFAHRRHRRNVCLLYTS